MNPTIVFNVQLTVSLVICFLVAKMYFWPKLKALPLSAALMPLLLVSSARFLGATLLVDNLNYNLPLQFMTNVGYGDLIASLLALLAAIVLYKSSSAGKGMAWLYTIVGTADFIYGVYLATVLNVYSSLGASWLVFVIAGPIQIVTMGMLWMLLLKKRDGAM